MAEGYWLSAIKRTWVPEWLYGLQAKLFPRLSVKFPLRQIFNRELTAREQQGITPIPEIDKDVCCPKCGDKIERSNSSATGYKQHECKHREATNS